ncbi:hypothetical protein ANN_22104 [Periplaneta americana]|uniref:Uncharacterized protein n=1 Tax=Periplaneta americana TaxID=6978 RepID=A0ABQ8S834_PERAM|nr:hypothetical protein ANN_22104 [Periplaneta americana]
MAGLYEGVNGPPDSLNGIYETTSSTNIYKLRNDIEIFCCPTEAGNSRRKLHVIAHYCLLVRLHPITVSSAVTHPKSAAPDCVSTASWCDVSANSREKAESHALAGLKVIEISPATSKGKGQLSVDVLNKLRDFSRNSHFSPVNKETGCSSINGTSTNDGPVKRKLQGRRNTTVPVSDYESDEIELDTDYDVSGVLAIFTDSLATTDYRRKECESNTALRKSGQQERSRDNLNDIREYSRKRNDIDRISLASS